MELTAIQKKLPKILLKAINTTNESSKVTGNIGNEKNIFEPINTIEKSMQSVLKETVCTETRRGRDSNPWNLRSFVFKTNAIDHSATSPIGS